MADTKRMVLGAGKLYVKEYTGEIPSDEVIEVEENLLGLIESGASISYTPEFMEYGDALGLVRKIVLGKEEAVLSSGLMTWNGNTLEKLVSTARVTEDTAKGIRTVKIGGIFKSEMKSYVVHFVHKDAEDGDIRVTLVGNNTAGLEIAFAKDTPTVVDVEFKAKPCDSQGTLIIYKEQISVVQQPTRIAKA